MKKLLRTLVVIIVMISVIIRLVQETDVEQEYVVEEERMICDEFFEDDTLKSTPVRRHYRTWSSYDYDTTFCLTYQVSSEAERMAWNERQTLMPRGRAYTEYWRDVYEALYHSNARWLSSVEDSLLRMAKREKLSRSDLAKMTVSFVQDIPYQYILPDTCDVHDAPCRDHEKFGILSPVEFLFSLSGDCDTRSVLLYTLLKNMGFSPMIVISKEYLHAMIALDIPASGDFIAYRGRRFYFWETTNVGWQPGMLPPDTNNITYWEIALDHEYPTLTAGID